jgi:bifunctional non-homologous end joining protein LigD
VIQKHAARRLHYDFRLELDGALKSWAVPEGPSLIAGKKRLAVHVEDHPLEYGGFEGVIPEGQYGGGTVMIWDQGHLDADVRSRRSAIARGICRFRLNGQKLHGEWHLVRMAPKPREKQEAWLLFKSSDAAARPADAPDVLVEMPNSAATGRSIEAIKREQDRTWSSGQGDHARDHAAEEAAPAQAGGRSLDVSRRPGPRPCRASSSRPCRPRPSARPRARLAARDQARRLSHPGATSRKGA